MVPENIRCTIRDDHIDITLEDALDLLDGFLARDVTLNNCGALDRRHLE